MITKDQWRNIKKGDVLIMTSGLKRPVISVRNSKLELEKVYPNGYSNETTIVDYENIAKKIEHVARNYTVKEVEHAVSNMAIFGGSFVKALAECFAKADRDNLIKLIQAFPEYVQQYADM